MPRGKILRYPTPDSLDKRGMEYIDKQIDAKAPVLFSELLLHLNLSHDALSDYEKREAYTAIVKKFKLHVMRDFEAMLHTGKPVGGIFGLKSLSGGVWSDGAGLPFAGTGEMTIKWTKTAKK